jgi:hypothetical protein
MTGMQLRFIVCLPNGVVAGDRKPNVVMLVSLPVA